MLNECFHQFSSASGLVANQGKSCIYFGGVPEHVQQQILASLGFSLGELPFRYLGVPLSAKRLSVNQCQPLLDIILAKVQSWTTRFLSYAGRLQMIISVLLSIQSFWTQVFPLPKNILMKIESICKKFLWTGEVEGSKKAVVAWTQLCWPNTAGGLNITDIVTWNKAAILKQMWNLCNKKDRLWIKWMHIYYIKKEKTWNVKTNQAAWTTQKILKAGKLYTKDRLLKWGSITSAECVLCEAADESHDHLFFTCKYSSSVWEKVLNWAGIGRRARIWSEEIKWASTYATGRKADAAIYRMILAGAVYYLWQERNWRIFKKKKRKAEELVRMIVQDIHCRGSKWLKLEKKLQALNFYP
ncbi:PREDICTED: uncharacterized protein LOC109227583 [Nicotiana attenuata]|uniref:uncharacterized protein LOC109227583 n=1 Tax=Nicotiana attenuata TaxID=49451 RepID=UPI000904D823|nr:PREDICTED: uncharacterized protein LOC109227583 [Nicotiana attenuata]